MSTAIDDVDAERRLELARFLRMRRERTSPATHGLAQRRRRRARGLLREEVAELAGVSITWYTWLEQARDVNPSSRVLDGLADALQLDAAERAHLHRLAKPELQPYGDASQSSSLSSATMHMLHGLSPHPAYAFDDRWNVLGWNAPAELVFGGFELERNILRRLLIDPAWRRLFVDWSSIVESAVAQFRAATAHLAGDPALRIFLDALAKQSSLFRDLWKRGDVQSPPTYRKILQHEAAGLLEFQYAAVRFDSDERVRLTIYTPADEGCARRVRELTERASVGARSAS